MYTAFASPFGRASSFAGAYRQVGVQTGVSEASPHQLVTMLFDGLADAMAQASGALNKGDVIAKGQAISKAVRIIQEGLKCSLDMKAGGKIAADLDALYAYISLQLTRANLHNDSALIAECQRLMEPVRQAWVAIGAQVQA
jgi:flagellar protein FliS